MTKPNLTDKSLPIGEVSEREIGAQARILDTLTIWERMKVEPRTVKKVCIALLGYLAGIALMVFLL